MNFICLIHSKVWIIGSTVGLIGDSAGANLMLGMTLWASDMNLRLPDGIFLAYVPLLVQFEPSPSRLLCLLDPLLPFGFMMRCLSGKFIWNIFIHSQVVSMSAFVYSLCW
jgi:hormone-sensitive lipase